METKNDYEYKHLRICEKWLQRANCSKCLFETLCRLEKTDSLVNEKEVKFWIKLKGWIKYLSSLFFIA